MAATALSLLLFFLVHLSAPVSGQGVDGGWSPWETDPEIDCCMYGGFERVRRYCNNPLPEKGGQKCELNPADGTGLRGDMQEKWRYCTCGCDPPCDGVTSFCANDTGKPAHCLCNWGWVRPTGYLPNNLTVCEAPATEATTVAPASDLACRTASDSDRKIFNILRYVGSFWVVLWMVAALVIFTAFMIFGPLRIIHMQEEITIGLTFLAIGILAEDAGSEGLCRITSALLQFLFLAAVIFFAVEALQSYSLVTYIVAMGGFCHLLINLAVGYGISLVTTGICIGVLWDYYGTSGCECFVNLDSKQPWAIFIPLVIFAFVGAIIAEAGGLGHYRKLPDADSDKVKDARISESSILMTMPLSVICYVLSMVAVHMDNMIISIFLLCCDLLLGPTIFVYHTMSDKTVRDFIHKLIPPLPCYKPPEDHVDEFAEPIEVDKKQSTISAAPTMPPSPKRSTGPREEDDEFVKWVTDGRDTQDPATESATKLFK